MPAPFACPFCCSALTIPPGLRLDFGQAIPAGLRDCAGHVLSGRLRGYGSPGLYTSSKRFALRAKQTSVKMADNSAHKKAIEKMEILGIGFGELILIVLLILILFGPKEMVATGRSLGRWLNRMVHSPTYKLLTKTSDELKNLPRNLMRQANLEEFQQEVQQIHKEVNSQTNAIGGSLSRVFDEKKIFDPAPPAEPNPPAPDESAPETPPAETPRKTE